MELIIAVSSAVVYIFGVLGSHHLFKIYYKNEAISLGFCLIWPMLVAVIGLRRIEAFWKALERAFQELNRDS